MVGPLFLRLNNIIYVIFVIYIYICINFFLHLCMSGHLGCFHVLTVVSSAVMNMGVQCSLQVLGDFKL